MKEKIIDSLGVIVAIGFFIFLVVCFIEGLKENWFWGLILIIYAIAYKLINKEYRETMVKITIGFLIGVFFLFGYITNTGSQIIKTDKLIEMRDNTRDLKKRLDNINQLASDRDYYWADLLDDIEIESEYDTDEYSAIWEPEE